MLSCELCNPHPGLDILGVRLGPRVAGKCMDYCPCVAAEHSLGIGLLPGADRSIRIRCRTLERIERRLLHSNLGARADASCGPCRCAGFLAFLFQLERDILPPKLVATS